MSGFAFPPPPPPPPSASSPTEQYAGNRGGFNNRGSRGRSRGRGNTRGGFSRGGFHQQNGSFAARQNSFSSSPTDQGRHESAGSNAYDPSAMVNAQTFTSNGFSNPVKDPQQDHGYVAYAKPNSSPHPGLKRTHNQAFNHSSPQPLQAKPDSKPKVPAPPSVPSFGFSLMPMETPVNDTPAISEPASTKKKQRKHNVLGLTPKGEVYEDSDDDLDEEALFAQSAQSGLVTYRGRSIQLQTAADVAAWIAERKKNFPTAARTAARIAAQEEARNKTRETREAETKLRQVERDKASQAKNKEKAQRKGNSKAVKKEEPETQTPIKSETNRDDPLARIAQLEEQLRQAREALAAGSKPAQITNAKVEAKVEQSVTKIKEAPDTVDTDGLPTLSPSKIKEGRLLKSSVSQGLGLDYSSELEGDQIVSEVSSEEPSSESSDENSDENSDSDAPPEQESARSRGPVSVPAPLREGPNKTQTCYAFANTGRCKNGDKCMRSHDVPCRYYAKHGHCRYGAKCRMSHDVTPGTGKKGTTICMQKPKTMTLRERMIENELKEEAMLGLQVIKQMGANGFFAEG